LQHRGCLELAIAEHFYLYGPGRWDFVVFEPLTDGWLAHVQQPGRLGHAAEILNYRFYHAGFLGCLDWLLSIAYLIDSNKRKRKLKMIEQTMQELKDEMAELRSAIATLTAAMQAEPAQQVEKKTKAEKPKDDAKTETAQEPKAMAVSRDDLQDLCMTIVRNERSKKAAVKDAIAAFGGASTLKDVPESDLGALKASLEALK